MKKYKVGFTAGAFDLCHAGHMLMFKDSKNVCEHLIVGLHIDPTFDLEYRKREKNQVKNKPIMTLEERKIILEGVKYVDEVVTYATEADLYELLKTVKFDVRILGCDWKSRKYTGWDLPHIPYFHNRNYKYSTSELRDRVYLREAERIQSITQPAIPSMERF